MVGRGRFWVWRAPLRALAQYEYSVEMEGEQAEQECAKKTDFEWEAGSLQCSWCVCH